MYANVTIAELWRPRAKVMARFYDAALIVSGSLLLALSAQLAIGFPVPISAQTFAVLLIGALLGPKRGAICVLAYLVEGAMGLPVFAQGKAGLVVFLGPTGGYLVGFIAAAYIVGLLAKKGWDRRFLTTFLAMLIGSSVIYLFGVGWLSCLVGAKQALIAGLYPFVVGDILKALLAAMLLPAGWKLLERFDLPGAD